VAYLIFTQDDHRPTAGWPARRSWRAGWHGRGRERRALPRGPSSADHGRVPDRDWDLDCQCRALCSPEYLFLVGGVLKVRAAPCWRRGPLACVEQPEPVWRACVSSRQRQSGVVHRHCGAWRMSFLVVGLASLVVLSTAPVASPCRRAPLDEWQRLVMRPDFMDER
jgi:hypothetical protein